VSTIGSFDVSPESWNAPIYRVASGWLRLIDRRPMYE